MSLFDDIRKDERPLQPDDRVQRVEGSQVIGTVMKRVRNLGLVVRWDDGLWSTLSPSMLRRVFEEES